MILGIDVGRVLISPGDSTKPDTSFLHGPLEAALDTPPYDAMFDVVPGLVEGFEGRAWIVSKCGPRIQQRTLQWFAHHRFFERTGIPRNNVRFCLQRPEKALHCRELGITHFIDDRADVLEHDGGHRAEPLPVRAAARPDTDWHASCHDLAGRHEGDRPVDRRPKTGRRMPAG